MLRVEATTRVGALDLDVALRVGAGECLALAGPSGAGKTTVLRVAAGLLRPERGLVEADGETWLDTERGIDLPPEQRRCGYVFQDYALFPHLSAWQNVAYPLRGVSRRERRTRAQELLERFGLGGHADDRPSLACSPVRRACCCSTSRCPLSMPARARERRASSQRY